MVSFLRYYKLLVTDWDGTVCTQADRNALLRASRSLKTVVASGREYESLWDITKVLDLKGPHISDSGSVIFQHSRGAGEFLDRNFLGVEIVKQIVTLLDTEDIRYHFMPVNDSLDGVVKLAVLDLSFSKAHDILKSLSAFPVYAEKTPMLGRTDTRFSVDILPEGMNKGSAVKKVCKRLKIPYKRTIAIGDTFNDLTMLRVAGLPLMIGNPYLAEMNGYRNFESFVDAMKYVEEIER